MAKWIPDSPNPHPDYPVGSAVRVRSLGVMARPAKRNLVGRVGTVVRSSKADVLVEFQGEQYREHFAPHELDRVSDVA